MLTWWNGLGASLRAALVCGVVTLAMGTLLVVQSARLGNAKADLKETREAQDRISRELKATEASRAACAVDRTSLRQAIDERNAQIQAQRAESEQRAIMLADALAQARGAAQDAQRRSKALQTHQITGKDACARLLDVDRAVLEALGR